MSKIVILKNQTYLSSKSIYHNLEGGGRVSLENALNHIYPIGSIFITTVNQDPSPYLGGKWESFGAGRVLVGFDFNQTEFNTILKTGGSKYLQKHNHEIGSGDGINSYIFGFAPETSPQVGPNHYYIKYNGTANGPSTIIGAKNTGNGDSGNLQPYIVVYMFKRIS